MRLRKIFSRMSQSKRPPRMGLPAFCLLVMILSLLTCTERPVFREEILYPQIKQPAVRVRLPETENNQVISSDGSFLIRCISREGHRPTYHGSAEMLVTVTDAGLTLSEKTQGRLETGLWRVSFLPKEGNNRLYLNGKPYRGALEMAPGERPGSLLTLNLIHVEEYLKGVVPAEIGKLKRREMEALKAQAVAARTYSLSRLGQYGDKGYDLEATVADQVYQGQEGEDPLASRAVDLTRGEVLVHEGKLISAYYHANSGGSTEYVEKVWDVPRERYLVPVNDAAFCSWSETFAWEVSWTKETLEQNLTAFLDTLTESPTGRLGNLLDLRIAGRSSSGRVEVLSVVTEGGTFQIPGDKIRWALKKGDRSGSILPSTYFDLVIEKDQDGDILQVKAQGRGNGHGVGMCQSGAIGMARKGYAYQDILTHYYPDAQMIKCY